ncbi:Major membrane immunogen, membrane-anchored lipoprotein [Caloramator quimbayensis]|uniref:Major membrane immunogen, membrane-anchored lipoprotein n=1 Tax=Caloramator quimbayensis TaxID=1147123 RepID=A0A1T4WQM0_9CLOT|nr:FMN-binding protein [Caloramator quimbayensis]SKA79155.1 Major membrane immunogen, membrane-anchored lipoprotein [Caloramator quimbayensis]
MKNKIISMILSLILITGLLSGCGSNTTSGNTNSNTASNTSSNTQETQKSKYADGIYFAQADDFDAQTGWKDVVTLEVKDGKIVSADWNGANKNGGADKKTVSKEGKYGMKQIGKAQSEWHEQAQKAEAYLIEKQDPKAITYKDAEGHTDAISGVSIHVMSFFKLAEKALANGPVQRGPYKDGTYHAEQANFDPQTGWKETVDITVINGNIVAANWNGVNKAGGDDKKTQSAKGIYGMKEKGKAQSEWHEQAQKVEAYLIEKQDPKAITYKDAEGHTDAISGVSIHVMNFFKLAEQALSQAK